jgi:hypothetical protein
VAIDGRRAWVLGVIVIVLLCAKSWMTNVMLSSEAVTVANMAAVKETAQPLIDALEKYRADNGFYPKTLDSLTVKYVAPEKLQPFHTTLFPKRGVATERFLYSGHWYDRVITKSDGCAARAKSLDGRIMELTTEYQQQVAQFELDGVTGYRNYELQSGDFFSASRSQRIERWAFYGSQQKQWNLGWCSYERRSSTAENGVCRR